jgi:hypothetical protein
MIELPSLTNDLENINYIMQQQQEQQYQQKLIDASTMYKTKPNYNSNDLQQRQPYQYQYQQHSKKYQYPQKSINYYNSIKQNPAAEHIHSHQNNGIYYYKVENFTSFGTISCNAENTYGNSGFCNYHIMVAGKCFIFHKLCFCAMFLLTKWLT